MYLNKIRNRQPVSQSDLYERMKVAIERIEAVFDPRFQFVSNLETRRKYLANMKLDTLADIAAWESEWLSLIHKLIAGTLVESHLARPKANK